MIERIEKWRIQLDGESLVIKCNSSGLVKSVVGSDKIRKKYGKELLNWNIFSVIRHLVEESNEIEFYRWKDVTWTKLNTEKIKSIANSAME